MEQGERVQALAATRTDRAGRTTKISIWHELPNGIWGAASTSPRIVNSVRILLGEDISFFHGKVMLKEAHTYGAWEWHQDYGYWYDEGFVFPRMMSAFAALDPCTRENGCLQVMRGSHKLGRLNHGLVGDQAGADAARLRQIEAFFEPTACEMTPGAVLFFHCNLLHASSPNTSDKHRRAFIMTFNALANPQLGERTTQPGACPVSADDAILKFAR